MAISAEQLNVILSARDREFTRAMERAERRVQRFSNQSSRNLSQTSQAWGALAMQVKAFLPALSAGVLVSEIRRVVSEGARIENLARLAGTTSEEFQRFAAGARTVGFDMDKTADIIKDVNDKVGDFLATGAGPMADFFENVAPLVGVTADQFRRLSGQEALMLYVSSLEKANLSQSEMTFYLEAIANDATALLPLLTNNAQEMRSLGAAADEAGTILSNEMTASAKEAELELGKMSAVISANLSKALLDLSPLLVTAAQGIAGLTGYVATFLETMKAAEAESGTNILQQRIDDTQKLLDLYDSGDPDAASRLLVLGGVDAARENLARLREEYEALTQTASDTSENMVLPEVVIDSAADLSALEQMVELQREEARLAQLTAEERERARIAKEAEAAVTKAIADQDLNAQETEEVERLRQAYIDAATAASSILNPVKAAGGATREIADAAADAEENITQMIERMIDASPALKQLGFDAENLQSVMGTVESSMENAFMSMLDGTATAGDAFRAMAADIIRELYRVLVVQRLVGSFTAGGGGIMGGLFSALGGRASGGPVQAGQPYTVGEHGRELFVPSTSGRVLSAAQTQNAMRGGGDVTIHQTFQFSANGDESVKRIIAQEAPKIAALTQKQIVDQRRRGGAMKGAFG